MVSQENTNWFSDYGLIEEVGNFPFQTPAFDWPVPSINCSSNIGIEIDSSLGDPDSQNEMTTKKRGRSESAIASNSKACREKLRRDRLNDKFLELGSLLEHGRNPKTDKAAILLDAAKMITQLRSESQKLKDSNSNLQEKIKELKAEKNELREEKQRLKGEKERLEREAKAGRSQQQTFISSPTMHPSSMANKLVPFVGYPGVAMWQFMPPASVDTSQDHVLRPPVA